MKAQRIFFVTTSFPRFDGDFAGSFVFRIAYYLAQSSVDVLVLAPGCPNYPTEDEIRGVKIVRFSYFYPTRFQRLAYGSGILGNLRQSWLARIQVIPFLVATMWSILLRQSDYDIIHCHWLPMALAALLVRPFTSVTKPIILTNWGSDTRLLPSWLIRWVVNRVDGCISTAVETDEHLLAVGRTEFRQIMAPVEEERFSRKAVAPDLRQELNLKEREQVLAFIGRLDAFKDPLTFIHACAILKKHGNLFRGVLVGDGDLMRACKKAIIEHNLEKSVLLLGMRSDPERLLRIDSVAVHISPVENTWANVIAEAMFMKVPVVLTRVGYTERLFTHEKDCLLIPPQDPKMLAAALGRLLESPNLRDKLVVGACRLLRKKNKDSKSIIRETRSYYDEVLNRRLNTK
jgi:glycosyltransferase involved in cell wall biosynthesis